MKNNSEKAIKSGFWYVVSNVLIRAIGIITAPVYTRLLSTADTGYANNFNNDVAMITVVTCLCLIYSVGRAKIDFSEEFDKYMSSIQTLSSTFGLIVLIIVMIFTPAGGMNGYSRILIFLMFAYLVIYPSIDYMQYKYRFEYRYKENILISVIITVTTVLLSIGLILLMPSAKGTAKILGTVLPSAAVGLWCYFNLLKSGRTLYNKKYWRYALRIGIPMIPHGLAMIVLARIDTQMIKSMCGFSDAGLYTSGYTIGTLLLIITNAVGQAWLPWFNERLADNDREAIRKKNMILMEAGCFISMGFVVVAPEIVKILYAKPYWESMWVVPAVALGTLCQYFYTNYVNEELFYKKTLIIAVNSIIAALVNAGLNYIYIQKYGYIAAAYTTLAGYFILLILHFMSTRIILKEKIYDDLKYFIMLVCTIIFSIGFTLLYDRWMIRYASAVILFIILAFIKKNDIIEFVDFMKHRKDNV